MYKIKWLFLFVEQNIPTALAVCSRVYIMEKGMISFEGTSSELKNNPQIINKHLGVSLWGKIRVFK